MAKQSVGTSRSSELDKESESIHVTIFFFCVTFQTTLPFFYNENILKTDQDRKSTRLNSSHP